MHTTVPIEIENDAPDSMAQLPPPPGPEKDNPYLTARRLWDERYGDIITRARNWRAIALLLAIPSSGERMTSGPARY